MNYTQLLNLCMKCNMLKYHFRPLDVCERCTLPTWLYTKTHKHVWTITQTMHSVWKKKSVVYFHFLRLKRLHYESEYLLKTQTLLYLYLPEVSAYRWHKGWKKRLSVTREDLLNPQCDTDCADNHKCWSQHITGAVFNSRRLSQNSGPFWGEPVQPETNPQKNNYGS